eukprot:3742169-Prymnesium_polylepis.1
MPRALRVAAAGAGLSVVAYFLYRRWKDGQLAFAPLDYTRSDTWFKRDTHGDKQCDLFYVHPTTVIGLISPNTAPPVGATVLKDTMSGDPDLLENHCGAFAADCNVWAPMYAQAGMLQQVCKVNMDSSPKATPEYEDELIAPLLIAYADIKRVRRRPPFAQPMAAARARRTSAHTRDDVEFPSATAALRRAAHRRPSRPSSRRAPTRRGPLSSPVTPRGPSCSRRLFA